MSKIDLTINKEGLLHNIQKAKENNIIIPTIAQMQNPDLIPEKIKAKLSHTGLWDVDPLNLFRITRHNEPTMQGGTYGESKRSLLISAGSMAMLSQERSLELKAPPRQ